MLDPPIVISMETTTGQWQCPAFCPGESEETDRLITTHEVVSDSGIVLHILYREQLIQAPRTSFHGFKTRAVESLNDWNGLFRFSYRSDKCMTNPFRYVLSSGAFNPSRLALEIIHHPLILNKWEGLRVTSGHVSRALSAPWSDQGVVLKKAKNENDVWLELSSRVKFGGEVCSGLCPPAGAEQNKSDQTYQQGWGSQGALSLSDADQVCPRWGLLNPKATGCYRQGPFTRPKGDLKIQTSSAE
ncbi:hypothetical protein Bbelb_237320 [Branchiostoma belcheri]|nr:hypothetical protein Bbelb_237320 [Branchiostoma belcheri]